MADLNPLLQLRKFRLEEKQRALSRLYGQVEELETEKRAILDSVESEKSTVDDNMAHFALMSSFMAYVQKSKKQVEEINKKISALEIKIRRAVDETREAFGEMKKIEITRDRRLQEIQRENQKKEDALFSEIALEIYRRSE
jgi:flagellar biosynthesis chaperone FliJ